MLEADPAKLGRLRQALCVRAAAMKIIRGKGRVKGTVEIVGLPECKMFSVSLCFFEVLSLDSPAPFDGMPPAHAYSDEVSLKEAEEVMDGALTFVLSRPSGFYFLDVGVIAYFEKADKFYAQVEHFFPLERAIEVKRNVESVFKLTPKWPDIPLDELESYGTMKPGGGGKLYDA